MKRLLTILLFTLSLSVFVACTSSDVPSKDRNKAEEISEFFLREFMKPSDKETQKTKIKNYNNIYERALKNQSVLNSELKKKEYYEYINFLIFSEKEDRASQIGYLLTQLKLLDNATLDMPTDVLNPVVLAAQKGDVNLVKMLMENGVIEKTLILKNGVELDLLSISILSCKKSLLESKYLTKSKVNRIVWKKYGGYFKAQMEALCPEYSHLIPVINET